MSFIGFDLWIVISFTGIAANAICLPPWARGFYCLSSFPQIGDHGQDNKNTGKNSHPKSQIHLIRCEYEIYNYQNCTDYNQDDRQIIIVHFVYKSLFLLKLPLLIEISGDSISLFQLFCSTQFRWSLSSGRQMKE